MFMQVQTIYSRPMAAARHMRIQEDTARAAAKPSTFADKTEELRAKRQELQNEILLIRGGSSDSAELSAERLKNLEDELEDITAEMRSPETPSIAEQAEMFRSARRSMDWYEPGMEDTASPGIYSLAQEEGKGLTVSFEPYSE